MVQLQNSLAFTGHRSLRFLFQDYENHPDCLGLKKEMREALQLFISKGVTTYYTGIALGTGIWFAEIILELKEQHPHLKLIAVLPYEEQATHWKVRQQERHYDILSKCHKVIYISKKYTPNYGIECNRYVVDHALHLLAVFDGREPEGTTYAARYAMSLKRDIVAISAQSKLRNRL